MTTTIERAIREAVAAGGNRAMARQTGFSGLHRLADKHSALAGAAVQEWIEGPTFSITGGRPLIASGLGGS